MPKSFPNNFSFSLSGFVGRVSSSSPSSSSCRFVASIPTMIFNTMLAPRLLLFPITMLVISSNLCWGQQRSSNSSSLFDSINRDLDEIKATITKTLKSPRFNASSYEFVTDVGGDSDQSIGGGQSHFLESLDKDRPFMECSAPNDGDSLWKFSIPYLNESMGLLRFREFRGKPLLLVNVATFCESTIEYPLYNDLKDKYGDDLIIVGFPSNNFMNQEPTDNATEIYNAIKYVRPGGGFVPKFPLTERIDVNGENQNRIYSFLKRCCPSTRTRFNSKEQNLFYKPKNSRDIRWNFEKFLIHPNTGYPIKRYDQKFLPDRIVPDIDRLLEELNGKKESSSINDGKVETPADGA